MMIPAVYRFEVTLDKDQIERYNRWRSNLPHTAERSIVNWVSRPFGDDAMMRSYYDQESNTVVVYTGNEVINEVNEYLILGEPILRNDGELADMMITSSDLILILSVLKTIESSQYWLLSSSFIFYIIWLSLFRYWIVEVYLLSFGALFLSVSIRSLSKLVLTAIT